MALKRSNEGLKDYKKTDVYQAYISEDFENVLQMCFPNSKNVSQDLLNAYLTNTIVDRDTVQNNYEIIKKQHLIDIIYSPKVARKMENYVKLYKKYKSIILKRKRKTTLKQKNFQKKIAKQLQSKKILLLSLLRNPIIIWNHAKGRPKSDITAAKEGLHFYYAKDTSKPANVPYSIIGIVHTVKNVKIQLKKGGTLKKTKVEKYAYIEKKHKTRAKRSKSKLYKH